MSTENRDKKVLKATHEKTSFNFNLNEMKILGNVHKTYRFTTFSS